MSRWIKNRAVLEKIDDSSNAATGAVKLGDQHEWRNGRFRNFLKKQEQDHCIPLRNMFQMLGISESERSDDDDMEAPTYVFDDNENGRWIREEAVVDSGAIECVTSRKRMYVPSERGGDTRVKRHGRVEEGETSRRMAK